MISKLWVNIYHPPPFWCHSRPSPFSEWGRQRVRFLSKNSNSKIKLPPPALRGIALNVKGCEAQVLDVVLSPELGERRRKIEARITAGLMEEMGGGDVILQRCTDVRRSSRLLEEKEGFEWKWTLNDGSQCDCRRELQISFITDSWGWTPDCLLGSNNQWQARYSHVTRFQK